MKSFLDAIPRLDLDKELSNEVSSNGTVGLDVLQKALDLKYDHTDWTRRLNRLKINDSQISLGLKPYQQVTIDEANFIASKSTGRAADSVIAWLIDCKNERNRLLEEKLELAEKLRLAQKESIATGSKLFRKLNDHGYKHVAGALGSALKGIHGNGAALAYTVDETPAMNAVYKCCAKLDDEILGEWEKEAHQDFFKFRDVVLSRLRVL